MKRLDLNPIYQAVLAAACRRDREVAVPTEHIRELLDYIAWLERASGEPGYGANCAARKAVVNGYVALLNEPEPSKQCPLLIN